uniref:RING-CH-type domain-containing protein n=2 Tax=Pyramimonas obovata TaxID=1411642 RepID=A0A7S0R161_9CHLO|mmetsp:Transcript_22776/g.49931  ORF Transcript_22776/g.49931 Transcript_22776/m.49931 type:complete len:347 (+) Transcript_22776:108-1148(+)
MARDDTSTDEPCCRICYDGAQTEDSGLVSPCGCAGSSAHIHVTCLKKLYLSRRSGLDRLRCPTCKQKYDIGSSLMLATFDLTRLRSEERAIAVSKNQEKADAYSTMGKVLCEMGLYQTASSFYELDLTLKQATYGFDHPAVALSLNNKGVLLCRQHKYDESDKCFERAKTIYERVHGPDSPQVANVLGNLSLLHRNNNNCERALQMLDRCLEILNMEKNKKNDAHELSLYIARMNRSMLLVPLGRVGEAEQLARVCLDFGRRAFSKSSPELANWEKNLAYILRTKAGEVNTTPKPMIENSPVNLRKRGRCPAPRPQTMTALEDKGDRPSKQLKVDRLLQLERISVC